MIVSCLSARLIELGHSAADSRSAPQVLTSPRFAPSRPHCVRRFYRSSYGWTGVFSILIVTAQLAYLRFKVDVTRSLPAQKVLAHPLSVLNDGNVQNDPYLVSIVKGANCPLHYPAEKAEEYQPCFSRFSRIFFSFVSIRFRFL